jgi:type IV secretory pathway TraG/TraD family ATPase VirD4
MTLQQIGSRFDHVVHSGWYIPLVIYGTVALSSLAGLKFVGARVWHYLAWPFTSIATTLGSLIVIGIVAGITTLFGFNPPEVVQEVICFAVLIVVGFLGGVAWATRGEDIEPSHTRGAVVSDGAVAQRDTRRYVDLERGEGTLTLAGVAVPRRDETKHFKLMGTTGSGKSTALRELLCGALTRGDRAVIADPDGTYLSTFYTPHRGDVILNPFDRRSAKWDLFSELKQPYDIDQLARALIPDRGNADHTWTSYARTFFGAIVRQARALNVQDLGELYRILTVAERQELKLLTQGTAAAPFLEEGNDEHGQHS